MHGCCHEACFQCRTPAGAMCSIRCVCARRNLVRVGMRCGAVCVRLRVSDEQIVLHSSTGPQQTIAADAGWGYEFVVAVTVVAVVAVVAVAGAIDVAPVVVAHSAVVAVAGIEVSLELKRNGLLEAKRRGLTY